jgi:adenylosuccinate lyase
MLAEMTEVLQGLRVHPERMRENLDAGGGLAFSQAVLLALVDEGLSRDEAYAIVQAAAAKAWDEGGDFREEIIASVGGRLSAEQVQELFDPERSLRNLDGVFDRLEKLEGENA